MKPLREKGRGIASITSIINFLFLFLSFSFFLTCFLSFLTTPLKRKFSRYRKSLKKFRGLSKFSRSCHANPSPEQKKTSMEITATSSLTPFFFPNDDVTEDYSDVISGSSLFLRTIKSLGTGGREAGFGLLEKCTTPDLSMCMR